MPIRQAAKSGFRDSSLDPPTLYFNDLSELVSVEQFADLSVEPLPNLGEQTLLPFQLGQDVLNDWSVSESIHLRMRRAFIDSFLGERLASPWYFTPVTARVQAARGCPGSSQAARREPGDGLDNRVFFWPFGATLVPWSDINRLAQSRDHRWAGQ